MWQAHFFTACFTLIDYTIAKLKLLISVQIEENEYLIKSICAVVINEPI